MLNKPYKLTLVALTTILGLNACSSGTASSETNPTPLNLYQNWVTSLSSSGYQVVQGSVFLMQNTDCPFFVSIFNSCFGQNPAAPYIIPQLPVESSFVDPYYATQLLANGPTGESSTDIIYRLGNNDAMVTIVSYPPEAAYFGYQSYVFSRESSNYIGITPSRPRTLSPDPTRYDLFASIGNDVNNTVVQNQYTTPWGGTVVVYITTPNQTLANAIVENASAYGLNSKSLFIEAVGANVLTGNTQAADDMVTLMRYAVSNPANSAQAASWQSSLSKNVLVYKISNASLGVTRYGANQYTARSINKVETDLNQALLQLSQLLKAYLEQVQPLTTSAVSAQTVATETNNAQGIPVAGLVGSNCIAYGEDCEGDNQDTSTYATLTESALILGPNDNAFIAGVNHSLSNNNNYLSVDIYNAVTSTGLASSSQTNITALGFSSGVLNGSAQQVLTKLGIAIPLEDVELTAHIAELYITFMTRNCNNPTLAAANSYCINLNGTSLLSYSDPITIFERSYILPGTTTGGDVNYMVYPYIIAKKENFVSP